MQNGDKPFERLEKVTVVVVASVFEYAAIIRANTTVGQVTGRCKNGFVNERRGKQAYLDD